MKKTNNLEEIRNYENRYAIQHNHGVSPKLTFAYGTYRDFMMMVIVAYHSEVSDSDLCIVNTERYAEACRYFNKNELTVIPTHHRIYAQA